MTQLTNRARRRRQLIRSLLVSAVTLFVVGEDSARAQSLWELSPYRVKVVLLRPHAHELSDQTYEQVERRILDGCSATVGASWEVTIDNTPIDSASIDDALLASDTNELDASNSSAEPTSSSNAEPTGVDSTGEDSADTTSGSSETPHVQRARSTLPPSLIDNAAEFDKLFLLAIRPEEGVYRVSAREYDVRTQTWSPIVERHTALVEELGDLAFRALIDTFSPLAMIVSTENRTTTLRVRGAALPTRDPTVRFTEAGDLFRPIVRHNDREGAPRAIQTIPWTFLRVEAVDDTDVECRVITGLRSPLSARRRGRVEQLATKMRFSPSPTSVRLRSLSEAGLPMVGCAVYAYGPDSSETVELGRTDRMGRIVVPPSGDPLRILLVKNGTTLLAKLPLVPGFRDELEVVVPDDRERLNVEAEITGIQEALVDFIAEREILLARAERKIAAGDIDQARDHVDALSQLTTGQNVRFRLRQLRHGSTSDDPRSRQRIERLIEDTQQLVDEFLDTRRVDALRESLRQTQATAVRDSASR